jgi:hypothetical protein
MKKLRAVTIFILVFGGFFFLFGVSLLSTLEQHGMSPQLRQYAAMHRISMAAAYSEIFNHSIAYAVIGLASIVSAAGLFFLKEWARKLWLGLLILMAAGTVYWFIGDYNKGLLSRIDSVVGYPLTIIFLIGMWLYFTRESTKDYFQT